MIPICVLKIIGKKISCLNTNSDSNPSLPPPLLQYSDDLLTIHVMVTTRVLLRLYPGHSWVIFRSFKCHLATLLRNVRILSLGVHRITSLTLPYDFSLTKWWHHSDVSVFPVSSIMTGTYASMYISHTHIHTYQIKKGNTPAWVWHHCSPRPATNPWTCWP